MAVAKLRDLVLQCCELYRVDYQELILATRDYEMLFKSLSHLKELTLLPKKMTSGH